MFHIEPTFLTWDSQFFARKIGAISITPASADTLGVKLEAARKQQYDLIYAFVEQDSPVPDSLIQSYNGRFVDHKLVYEQNLVDANVTASAPIRLVTPNDSLSQLYELGYQSGEYSRFRIDPSFGEVNFQRLYRQWVDNSVSGSTADAVFIWVVNNFIVGFITVKKKGDTGIIGLLAANTQHRGRGIGTELLNYIKAYAVGSKLTRLEVATQGGNILACRFYEKNRFTVKSETNVYHFWL